MIDINKLSWAIYEELKAKGADVGNASVPIIESVIDKHVAAQQSVAAELLPRQTDRGKIPPPPKANVTEINKP